MLNLMKVLTGHSRLTVFLDYIKKTIESKKKKKKQQTRENEKERPHQDVQNNQGATSL